MSQFEIGRLDRRGRPGMIYIKATAVGVIGGLLLATLWVVAAVWLPAELQMLRSSMRSGGGGIGAAVVGLGSVVLAALIGFVAGLWWTVLRARRRQFSH